jgi:hypothetical protein
MATKTATGRGVTFGVLDAMDAPHTGRILRLRLQSGEAPSIKRLKSARLVARGPDGQEVPLEVKGFPTFGGKPTDERLARSGRVDLHVEELGDDGPVGLRWNVSFS